MVHNPKSNFLDTVKPPPARHIAPPHRLSNPIGSYPRSYPLSYPSPYTGAYSTAYSPTSNHGPNGTGTVHRPQQQLQTQAPQQNTAAKPYEYKPKHEIPPNAPRPFQYGSQPGVPGYPTIQSRPPSVPQYTPTSDPTNYDYSTGLSTTTHLQHPSVQPRAPSTHTPSARASSTHAPNAHSPSTAHTPVRLDNSPPYRHFYQEAEQRYAQPKAMDVRYKALASPKPTPPLPTSTAPIVNMLGPAVSTPFMPPSQRGHSASVSTNESYIAHIMKYPYLRNAFLRRPKTYSSPYATGFGFTPEYQAKLVPNAVKMSQPSLSYELPPPPKSTPPATSPPPTQSHSQSLSPHSPSISVPNQVPRSHVVRYETPQQFQQNVHRELEKATSPTGSKFDFLISQINQSKGRSNSASSSHENDRLIGIDSLSGPPQKCDVTSTHQPHPSYAPQTSYSSAGPSGPPSYSLPPLQQSWSTSSHATSSMTRTRSRDGLSSLGYPPNPRSSPTYLSLSGSTQTNSAGPSTSRASQPTYTGPPTSYTPRTPSPERPDYSPLSDTAMPDASAANMQRRRATSMQVHDVLSRQDHGQGHRQSHYSHQQYPQHLQQHSHGQSHDQRPPVGLGLEGYKMS
jgi:hypothetical protein